MSPSSMNSRSSSPTRRNVARPMLMMSRSVTVAVDMRSPLTNVPLWLPRSMISYRPPPELRSSAWFRETLRSCTTRSLSGPRPMRSTRTGARITAVGRRSTLTPPLRKAVPSRSAAPGRDTEQNMTGPSAGSPRRRTQSELISTRFTLRDPMKVPLVLPGSSKIQAFRSSCRTAWCQDTRESVTTMSDCGSRPMRYVDPACSV